ncbi:MAG TPA: hypothetical protein VLT59_16905 [Steroidobacteraceae bacterium]|nr:hypothetical protein [Steroidobacteraceae bacterium]
MIDRTLRGRLVYRHEGGPERGRESFTITRHGDGTKTLRALCEIDADEVLRDVTYSVDAQHRPLDAFVRLTVHERFFGSGWFVFGEHAATCEAYTALEGRISQRVELRRRPTAFGTHPISADAWLTAAFEPTGPRRQFFDDAYVSSYAFNGVGALALYPIHFGLEYLGETEVTVPAGTFGCRHFRFLLDDSEVAGHPDYELFTTTDGLHVCVRAWVGAPKRYVYELAQVERN